MDVREVELALRKRLYQLDNCEKFNLSDLYISK